MMLPHLALAYALTAQLTCVFLGRLTHFADMREQTLGQCSDLHGPGSFLSDHHEDRSA